MARPWRDPNEPRKEKPTFFVKPKPDKAVPNKMKQPPKSADPYKDGLIRLFLDDERPCPPGFTLVQTLKQFRDFLESCDLSKLYTISLDWHLANGERGSEAAEWLADLIRKRRDEMTSMVIITCHSSDFQEAANMARTIAPAIIDSENDDSRSIYVDVNKPIGKF